MELYIVRHGETIENATGIIQGWSHGTLSKKGKEQAIKLAKRIEKINPDIIYCSDLRRCKQTIAPYLKKHKTKIIYTKDLRERSQGIFDGKSGAEASQWKKEKGIPTESKHKWKFTFPRGETFTQLKKRTKRILDKIIKNHKGEKVLIITHGQAKIALMLNIFKKPEETHNKKYKSENTGLSIINIKNDGNHRATKINSTRHLD